MRRWIAAFGLLGVLVLALLFMRRESGSSSRNPPLSDSIEASNAVVGGAEAKAVEIPQSALTLKVEELKQEALQDFEKLIPLLNPYGIVDRSKQTYVQQQTNRDGGIKIEIEVRTGTHKALFRAGPLDSSTAAHINPFQAEGLHLNSFEALYDGQDTRRKPEAANEWYRSTGTWTEDEAVAEAKRILAALGLPETKMAKHRFRSSTLTVKNPAGESVRVTPFYRVDVYDNKDAPDEDPGSLYIQYRIDDAAPARVTKLFAWPPVKIH